MLKCTHYLHAYDYAEDEINGLAFRKLKDADLKDMGFKRGPITNILDIISSLSVEVCSYTNFTSF